MGRQEVSGEWWVRALKHKMHYCWQMKTRNIDRGPRVFTGIFIIMPPLRGLITRPSLFVLTIIISALPPPLRFGRQVGLLYHLHLKTPYPESRKPLCALRAFRGLLKNEMPAWSLVTMNIEHWKLVNEHSTETAKFNPIRGCRGIGGTLPRVGTRGYESFKPSGLKWTLSIEYWLLIISL